MDNPEISNPDKQRVYTMVKEGSAAFLSVSALIFTVLFGIITLSTESSNANSFESIRSIQIPVIMSGALLIASMISGGVCISLIFDLMIKKGKDVKVMWSYRIQYWSFIAGLISVFAAVMIRLGAL